MARFRGLVLGHCRRPLRAGRQRGDPQLFVEQVGQGIVGLADGRIYPHIALSPVIALAADARSAKARWRIIAMLGSYGGNASFARGVYENAYAVENGVWKVQEIAFYNPRLTIASGAERTNVASFSDLASPLSALEPEVAQLAAENAVLNLQNAYGYYFDRMLWDDVADLFADGGTLEIGQSGVYVAQPVNSPSEASMIPPLHFRHPVTGRAPQYPAAHALGDPSVAAEPLVPTLEAKTTTDRAARLTALEGALDAAAAAANAENLVNAFGYYADEHVSDEAAQLFAADAWAEVPRRRVRSGCREAERRVAPRRARLRSDLGRESQPRLGLRYRWRASEIGRDARAQRSTARSAAHRLGDTALPAVADLPFHYSNPGSSRPPARVSF